MALLLGLLLLAAGLHPSFPADGNQDQASAALSTSLIEVQQEIVNKHNDLRKSVNPPASNMLKMRWNSEAAANAQKWANQCKYQHSNREDRRINISCGENLFMSSGPTRWSQAVQTWYDEKLNFDFGVGPKTPNAVVGHYTQVVWFSSYNVGCGYAYCPNEYLKHFMVCQYCPPGNDASRLYLPYTEGEPCGSCPDHCDNGLCTNGCEYENVYSNCDDLKRTLSCEHPLVKDNCKASCYCTDKIYGKPLTN
ncbi:cysteine-rich secretory protein 3-like [Lepus europaeus]|uniref:cysteine-rich secretory protein 3-like n=1 Tax=Lepus europaeus TaxID=9983 RepID=UPI002B46E1DD|nr:cysteine-rich secretory protein 3-like [Lepus europaeus]